MDKQRLSLREKVRLYRTSPVIFLHIDTTGLGIDDEIVRLTIIADDTLVYDEIFNSSREANTQALRASGLTNTEIQESTTFLKDEISVIENMICNKLIVCINDNFTKKYLLKAGFDIHDNDLLDLTQATDYFAKGTIKSAYDAMSFYGHDASKSRNTFEKNFVFYDCACKLKLMANTLLKN